VEGAEQRGAGPGISFVVGASNGGRYDDGEVGTSTNLSPLVSEDDCPFRPGQLDLA